jgi:hypothetical protein
MARWVLASGADPTNQRLPHWNANRWRSSARSKAELRQYFGFSASGTSLPGGPFEQLIGDLHHFDRHASSCVEGLARSGLFKK